MPNSPSRRKPEKADIQPAVIALPNLGKQGAVDLAPMNFRVPAQFHRESKIYAARQGMSMVDVLQKSFALFRKQRGF